MLQKNMQLDTLDGTERGGEGVSELFDWVLGFLRRQYLIIAITTALAFAASLAFLRIIPPTYTAQAKVLLAASKAPLAQKSALDETPVDLLDLESQIEVLKSKEVVTSVINQLKLRDDPGFNGKGGWLQSVWEPIRVRFGGTPQVGDKPLDTLIAEFQDQLSVFRIAGTVVELDFNSTSPERAAEIANATARAYIDDQLKANADSYRSAMTWLHDRLQELGNDALAAERSVNELKAKSNIVAADGKPIDDQQISELNKNLVAARGQTSQAMARLNRLENILASNPADSIAIGNLDGFSDALSNPIINALRRQYLDDARREAEYSARYGSQHLQVVNLRQAMKGIRQSILDEVRRLAESAKSDFEVAKQQQQAIEKQLAQAVSQSRHTSSAELSIRELETSAKGYRGLYENFLQRYMGSLQQGTFPTIAARIISPAAPPQKPSKSKTKVILAFGALGGIALGAALALAREIMDRSFRTSAQLESRLQLPCLSMVPLLRRRKKNSVPTTDRAEKHSGERTLSSGSGTYWAAMATPSSRFAESIRMIRFGIDLNPTERSNQVVGITSTLPSEGKSTIAAALAQLLANSGKRVIIVDCDLRNPSLSANLATEAGPGLVDVLLETRSLDDTIWTDPKTNLAFLPVTKRASNTSEILSTDQTKKLFNKLRANYDYVIVDLPPLAPICDVRATTPLIDCFVLVVEWGRTTTEVVQHALHSAPNVHDALIGTVLNKTDMKAMKRYANYYRDYYGNEHYVRYGHLTAE